MVGENSVLHYRNKSHFKIKKTVVLNYNISQYSCIFDQINAALVSIRKLFKKKIIIQPHTSKKYYILAKKNL